MIDTGVVFFAYMIPQQLITETAIYGYLHIGDERAVKQVRERLTAADHDATAGIKHEARRKASLLARGLTYYLFGQLSDDPDYKLVKSETGRPSLQHDTDGSQAFVSIAHSHAIVASVIDLHNPVGIDVEYCQDDRDYQLIARRLFTQELAEQIHSQENFYQAWCLYEAWGKANELKHIDERYNHELMNLLASRFRSQTRINQQPQNIRFFNPYKQYMGCIYSGAEWGSYANATTIE